MGELLAKLKRIIAVKSNQGDWKEKAKRREALEEFKKTHAERIKFFEALIGKQVKVTIPYSKWKWGEDNVTIAKIISVEITEYADLKVIALGERGSQFYIDEAMEVVEMLDK